MRVGIEKLAVYPGTLSLRISELAVARGREASYPEADLLAFERTVLPPWEDPVTMAVNSALGILDEADREAVELVVVASESGVDFGKAMATYVHEHCGVQARCRCFEVKQACYGGTAALMMAGHWLRSARRPGAKALVVCSDQSRVHFGRPWEFVMGAGAVAMLVGAHPEVLEVDLDSSGYWSANVHDTFRPSATEEVGNADTSLHCYLDALEGAYAAWCDDVGAKDADVARDFARSVYHVPFGGMTLMAHRTLLREAGHSAREARCLFERAVRPGLRFNARIGATYTAALFVALAGTLGSPNPPAPGDPVALFSYGSGSVAEFFRGRVGERATERIGALGLDDALDARRALSVEEYETIERLRLENTERPGFIPDRGVIPGHFESAYAGRGRLVLEGVGDDWVRHYAWS